MSVKRIYDPPLERTDYNIKLDMKKIAAKFPKISSKERKIIEQKKEELNTDLIDVATIREYLLGLNNNPDLCDEIINKNKTGENIILKIHGKDLKFEPGTIKVEKSIKKISQESFIPHIVEPSFGLDRIMYALFNNAFWIRKEDPDRTVLSFTENMAPITVSIMPLFLKDNMKKYVKTVEDHIRKIKPEFVIKIDQTTASIGKRYSRSDEMGIPYAITIDYDTEHDNSVTIRDRDSMSQIRVPIDKLFIPKLSVD